MHKGHHMNQSRVYLFLRFHPLILLIIFMLVVGFSPLQAWAQVPSHPEAQSPLPKNPYIKHTDVWRWDIKAQVFVRAALEFYYEPGQPHDGDGERRRTPRWPMKDLEVIYPALRAGSFYWAPNKKVEVSIRLDDRRVNPKPQRIYTKDTGAEYTLWRSDVEESINQIHITHTSYIVVADTVFDHTKARQLPWPNEWEESTKRYLLPVVDSVGKELEPDAADTIKTLLDFWVDDQDPQKIPQLDLVKFLTGKVIEYVDVRKPPAEFSTRGGNRLSAVAFVGGTTWAGFVVRSADLVARDPKGTKHDMATLLTSVLRSAGVPARTVLCVNNIEDDMIEKMVSMVEFAMYDPDRDMTFWVPIDIDKLRLTGKRSGQYKQPWLYFGTHDELNDYVPVAYYFHAPASYRAYDLPALYGLRSSSPLPEYAIQAIMIDPQMSPITAVP